MSYLIFSFLVNLIALWAAQYFVPGFAIHGTWQDYLTVTALLTIINLILKPIIKLILTPIIVLTLGLATIIINAALLWGLDIFSTSLTINGIYALLFASLLIAVINFFFQAVWRITKK